MEIVTKNLGKKFRNEWVFRHFDYQLSIGNAYAITGPNGSGKSTLMQAISSYIPSNEGVVKYFNNSNEIEIEHIFKNISITSPFLELIEEFTLTELIDFHCKLKPFSAEITKHKFLELIGLQSHSEKQIKYFSSGMKQKLKLGFCLFSNSPILLLDEPTTNLDGKAKNWFLENITKIIQNKLIILASNDPAEYSFTNNIIDIQQFK